MLLTPWLLAVAPALVAVALVAPALVAVAAIPARRLFLVGVAR